ncbi:hypothetical protein COLO4_35039 [Corchorus olitorius]|uniref:Uncharacterized protein n=1 Tax=Corchorus olitorius TaxID=93759 RepID=A0A1R3GIE7_9ROSI|nr:hypothetical protein COLO4_35039 [Corchorus olitorius]
MLSLLKAYHNFLLLALFFLSFEANLPSSSSSPTHLCSQTEATALIQFKTSFSIDSVASSYCDDVAGTKSYAKTESWKEGTDCCSWDGVSCDEKKGQVIGLDLNCSRLYGTFSSNSTLFHLHHLRELNLAFNYFNHSKMPSKFGGFPNLVYLNLSSSFFGGQVPLEVSHLSKLVSLDLSWPENYYPDQPLVLDKDTFKRLVGNLTQVRGLFLDGVDMSSINPSALMNLSSSLRSLSLRLCGLRGKFPSEVLHHLPKLFSLDLSWNFDEPLDKVTFERLVGNQTELRDLSLDGINMSSVTPNALMKLNLSSSLRSLSLEDCDLRGDFPENVFQRPKLKSLKLGGNQNLNLPKLNHSSSNLQVLGLSEMSISTGLLDSISSLQSLKDLILYDASFLGGGGFPLSIMNLSSLEVLNADGAQFSGGLSTVLPDSIGNLVSLQYLSLSGCSMTGSIPISLGNLSQLRVLELSFNQFRGQIPSSLTNLRKLTYLDLGYNQLEGRIPDEVNAFPNLIFLRLSSNLLNGTLPSWLFTASSSLRYIDLSHNQFSGPIPSSISQQLNLVYLRLSYNNLSGVVEYEMFSKLQNLTILDLSYNRDLSLINSNPSSADYTLPNLRYLGLASCKVTEFPPFLKASKGLESLDLSNNRIQGKIPKWMWDVGKDSLTYLNLSHNSLTQVEHLPWTGIEALDLSSNVIHGDLPIPPYGTSVFFISNNSLSGEISSLICNVTSLENLDLSHNNLSGVVPHCLGDLSSSLLMLNLGVNKLYGIIPPIFAEYCRLSFLNLNGNQLEGPLPRSIHNCRQLQVLDLGNNKINGTFPHWLGSLPNLQALVLKSNRFHGSIIGTRSDRSFSNIQIFDLSSNHFSGPLPVRYIQNFKAMINLTKDEIAASYMGTLNFSYSGSYSYSYYSIEISIKGQEMELLKIFTMLTTIDLSNNKFQGEIPMVIGKLNSLKGLNLSHNNLSGCIPSSIGDLVSLEWLDLSSNKLVGKIPQSLVDLTSLSVLNLSKNQLHGQIPQGKQFNTFGNDSYEGNMGLCGFPVSKGCSNNNETPPSNLPRGNDGSNSNITFGWKEVSIGNGCGLVFGLAVGYVVFQTGKPKWFVTLVEDMQHKRRKKPKIGNRSGGRRRI